MAKAWRALFGCIVATAGLAVVADRAAAAPGDLDVSYGSNGVSTLAVPPSSTGFVNRYLPLSDGGYYATAPGASHASPRTATSTPPTGRTASPPSLRRSPSWGRGRTAASSPLTAAGEDALPARRLGRPVVLVRTASRVHGQCHLDVGTEAARQPVGCHPHRRWRGACDRARGALRSRHAAGAADEVRQQPLRGRDAGRS